ncbi:hypothetical protein OGAPHI_005476 [Ogataea philodendri]|uniref:Uncharacterized protein n=1 Tax=Ogataea philodendri TaxID=1378263 RepID=A0A9P8NXT3_9ASCO|nr:uncharacterized protein OGAPHI_005476 [Ogataea philodendri]KAH3662228.1 hypothetical protein OGAPHI_005476 [Ogataea philodendri]
MDALVQEPLSLSEKLSNKQNNGGGSVTSDLVLRRSSTGNHHCKTLDNLSGYKFMVFPTVPVPQPKSTRLERTPVTGSTPSSGYRGAFLWTKMKKHVEGNGNSKIDQTRANGTLKQIGPDGEVYLGSQNVLELWDWDLLSQAPEKRALCLLYRFSLAKETTILGIYPLTSYKTAASCQTLVLVKNVYKEYELIVLDMKTLDKTVIQSKIDQHELNISVCPSNGNYFGVASPSGKLSVYSTSDRKLVSTFDCTTVNNQPVFDIVGSHLIYYAASGDPRITSWLKTQAPTPLRLAHQISVLNKIWQSFSKTVLDSMVMLSEISQSKVKKMFSAEKLDGLGDATSAVGSGDDEMLRSKKFREMLVTILNTLSANSSYVVVVDLDASQIQFCFSPPDGCSAIKMSPFDLTVATVTTRGDDIYVWDYTKYDKEITLIDKHKRGKTSAIVTDLFWSNDDRSLVLLSKLNGSIHSFANESLCGLSQTRSSSQSSDELGPLKSPYNWCLSNFGFKKIGLIKQSVNQAHWTYTNELVALTATGDVAVVDLATGAINWKVSFQPIGSGTAGGQTSSTIAASLETVTSSDPVSLMEVETCKPYAYMYNNRRVQFARFKDPANDVRLDVFGSVVMEHEDLKFGSIQGSTVVGELAVVVVLINTSSTVQITPPSWERVVTVWTTGTTNSKGNNKDSNLSTSNQCSSNNVVVLSKVVWSVLLEVELRNKSSDEVCGDRRVNTNTQPTNVPHKHWSLDSVESPSRSQPVSKVERQRQSETNDKRQWNDVVGLSNNKEFFSQSTPSNTLSVVLLDILTRPDSRGGLNVLKEVELLVDNLVHHDVVEDGTNNGTDQLSSKSVLRRKLNVVAHLQVTQKTKGLTNRVVTVQCEVHVSQWRLFWHGETTNHLNNGLHLSTTETKDTNQRSQKESHWVRESESEDQHVPWQSRVSFVQADKSHHEGKNEQEGVPPGWNFLISEHGSHVRIIKDFWQSAVGVQSWVSVCKFPELEVLNGEEFLEVEEFVLNGLNPNGSLVVNQVVTRLGLFVIKRLRQEWEVLRFPHITPVNTREDGDTEEVTEQVVDGSIQRNGQWRTSTGNVVPVETDGQEAQSFVTVGTTKDSGNVGGMWISETWDGETNQPWEHPFWKDLEQEGGQEEVVEVSQLFLSLFLVVMQGVDSSHHWDTVRVEHFGWVKQSLLKTHTDKRITNQLR